jgi:ubiquinone/menaquinone biosynthesis C-methylase UbiE
VTDERFDRIYREHAEEYHALVMREDHEGRLLPAILAAVNLRGRDVVELGAGTGRVTALVAPLAARVRAFDRSPAMLGRAARYLADLPEKPSPGRVAFCEAANTAVPLPDACTDVVIEGWSFGHSVVEAGEGWEAAASALLDESFRLLRLGGTLVVVETLGTGRARPRPPHPLLGSWYAWLEGTRGFTSAWARTDYRFASRDEAERLAGLFFGERFAYEPGPDGSVVLPECTGTWWKRKVP